MAAASPGIKVAKSQVAGPSSRRRIWEVFWVGFGYAAATLGQAAGVRILTGLLSPAAYGELALGVTIGLLLQQVIFAPASNSAARFFAPSQEKGSLDVYFVSLESLTRKTGRVFVLIAFLSVPLLWFSGLSRTLPLAAGAFAYAAAFGCASVMNGVQNAARQRPIVALHGGAEAWLRAGYAAALVLWLGSISTAALGGYFLASFTVLISQRWFYRRLKQRECSSSLTEPGRVRDLEGQMLRFGSPLMLLGILTWAQTSADRWALQAFQSTEAVGRYQAIYQISYQPLVLIAGFLWQLAGPILFARAGDGTDRGRLRNVYRTNLAMTGLILGFTACAAGIVWVLPKGVFALLLGSRFRGDLWLAPILIGSGGLLAATQIASLTLMAGNSTKSLLLPRLASAALSVALCLAGSRLAGLKGVAIGNFSASLLICLWLQILAYRPHAGRREGLETTC